MNFVTEYKVMETNGKYYSFIGMNTGEGFAGNYDKIITERGFERLYIIKGAAGTGKSTLMRKFAESAEKMGSSVRYYLCGSDPESLDCITINGDIAVLDGTAPHSFEMRYGGAVSEFIDTTRFWNSEMLCSFRSDIIKLNDIKGAMFGYAYSFLKAFTVLSSQRKSYIERAVYKSKIESYVSRLLQTFGKPKGTGATDELILRSVGMKGLTRLDTLEKAAKSIFVVNDMYSSAFVLMNCLSQKLSLAGFDTVISRDPVSPDNICEIFIPQVSLLITVENICKADKTINMSRFVNRDALAQARASLRRSYNCGKLLLAEAVGLFEQGGKAHFALESIYSSAMDFEALNVLADSVNLEMANIWS